jgi:hypothetical protein
VAASAIGNHIQITLAQNTQVKMSQKGFKV